MVRVDVSLNIFIELFTDDTHVCEFVLRMNALTNGTIGHIPMGIFNPGSDGLCDLTNIGALR